MTKYTIETTDKVELEMYLNASKVFYALSEIKEWRRELYRGKKYDWVVLYKGKLYSAEEWETRRFIADEKPQYLYTDDAILKRIDDALSNVENVLD